MDQSGLSQVIMATHSPMLMAYPNARLLQLTKYGLDTVRVEMYGQQMQLNQVATINAPEPRVLIVTPFDKGQIKIVEKAIRESGLGLEPSAQGAIIRVPLPAMNEQRRKELVKVVHKYAEEGRVAVRHARTSRFRSWWWWNGLPPAQ